MVSLYLQSTTEDVEALYDEDSALGQTDRQRGRTEKAYITIFRKRKEPWKRLRWVTLDDRKFDRLLDKAKSYIGQIEKFLEQAKQERRDRYLELCLRNTILHATGQQELGIIGKEYENAPSRLAIAAAARLKRTRLQLGFPDWAMGSSMTTLTKSVSTSTIVERHDSMNPSTLNVPPKEMKVSMRLLTLSRGARAQPLRALAKYDGRVVLLEWKYVAGMTDPTIFKRVNQVAALLQDLGPTLHSLKCRGFVSDHVAKRYGYIFDLPDDLNPPSHPRRLSTSDTDAMQPMPELRSLRQMLDQSSTPSLNIRLSLAVTLLDTLLNLHTSGWLHKELRSDNIILIRRTEYGSGTTRDDLSTYSVFIAGYVYSRLDSPGEMTEPLKSELEADLYRHPSLLCSARQSYHKSLDIFSVGCTLLEIGLWSSLRQILESHSTIGSKSTESPLPERSMSDPTLVSTNALEEVDDELHKSRAEPSRPDLMGLKHELLLSHLAIQRPRLGKMATQKSSLTEAKRSMVMRSLEAAMGKRYTTLIEEFLAAGNMIKETKSDEHEFALDLEMRARDIVQAIAEAM